MNRIAIDFDLAQWQQWLVLDSTFLILATALLWLPFPNLNKRFRMRWLLLRYTQPEVGKVLGSWQNYLDLLRAAVAAFVLLSFSNHLQANPNVRPELLWIPKASLLIGVLIQTVRWTSPAMLFAPVFYLGGITLVVSGYIEGGFAFLFGWAFAIGAKDVRWQLPVMGGSLALVGFFNQSISLWLVLNVGLIFLPLTVALMFNRRLAYPSREPRATRAGGKPRKLAAAHAHTVRTETLNKA